MPEIIVEGGAALRGTIGVGGAKNAALKEMVAAVLVPGRHRLTNVPDIADISLMADLLNHMGCRLQREGDSL
ncbi:MAG TPA: UDP-N-acetylglucosamine 1-carboxyvinyltransferase, partial [Acidimicrobiia bacterium]